MVIKIKNERKAIVGLILLVLLLVSGISGCLTQKKTIESPGPGKRAVDFNKIPNANVFKYENVGNFTIYNGACISVINSGNPSDKVDVTFLADKYADLNKFQSDVSRYIDYDSNQSGLLSVEPFKSNKGKFNFYLVNQTNDLECKTGCFGIDRLVCCNDQKVKQVATQCPSDKVIVLVDTTNFCGASKDYSTVCTIKDPRAGLVLTHEFGHIFGGFGDEYTYGKEGQYDNNVPNCDASPSCDKWNGKNETGCFKTCGYTNLYRSTDKGSLMNIYIPTFGPLDEELLVKSLSSYTNESAKKELLAAVPIDQSYIANINEDSGNLNLDRIYVTNSTSEEVIQKFNYLGRILSFDNQILLDFKIALPTQAIYDHSPQEEASVNPNEAGSVAITRQNYTFNIPYFRNGKTFEMYNASGSKVDSIHLAPFAEMCGDGICQSQENYLECSADCKLENKDNLCLPYADNICDIDCPAFGRMSDVDCKGSIFVNISIGVTFAILLVLALIMLKKRK